MAYICTNFIALLTSMGVLGCDVQLYKLIQYGYSFYEISYLLIGFSLIILPMLTHCKQNQGAIVLAASYFLSAYYFLTTLVFILSRQSILAQHNSNQSNTFDLSNMESSLAQISISLLVFCIIYVSSSIYHYKYYSC